ncbi:hypothetical protein FGIG_02670 [Fasciola gigantica]|uniref:RING-type domain-containing protein n=1 Tax=Fasciola gigantica TaxID=46835 RepID=A0A504YDZ0_FASGI|nr:hypothetical protein FGIG_02670 [Fasciola gigantica]
MGHSNSRLPLLLTEKVIHIMEQQFGEYGISSTELFAPDIRSLQRKVQRRVLRYLKSTYTSEQLEQMSYANAEVPVLTTNQQQTMHAIVRDSIVSFAQSRSRAESRPRRLVTLVHSNRIVLSAYSRTPISRIEDNSQIPSLSDSMDRARRKTSVWIRLNNIACLTLAGTNQIGKLPECPICLSDFELNDEVITLLCFHVFHQNCFLSWYERSYCCPICRIDLRNTKKFQRVTNKSEQLMLEDEEQDEIIEW